jgi:hypothetical protein
MLVGAGLEANVAALRSAGKRANHIGGDRFVGVADMCAARSGS